MIGTSNYCIEENECLYKDSAKAARIYDLILDNINFDQIEDSQIDKKDLNNMDSSNCLKYIKEIGNKKDETEGKINDFTLAFKDMLNVVIFDIQDDIEPLNNLYKLSAYYYLFKIKVAKDTDEEKNYSEKIDAVVDKILLNKDNYYKILKHLGIFKDNDLLGAEKNAKFDAYFKILFFLAEDMLSHELSKFMNNKKTLYKQYEIPLPIFSIKDKEIDRKFGEIYNILYILQRAESFKTNERFEYFHNFKSKPELLKEINYILYKMNKSPIIALDKINNDIAEEAINYSLEATEKSEKKEDIISELTQLLEEGKKEQNEYRAKNKSLEEQCNKTLLQYDEVNKMYNKLSQELTKWKNEYKELDNNYTNALNGLEAKVTSLKKKLVESNEKSNKQISEINSLKTSLDKKEEIIERISYREIGARIIKFFSLSQPEKIIKQYEENDVSPTNIKVIIKYMKNNLS